MTRFRAACDAAVCNGNPTDGCEVHIDADTSNCGACNSACHATPRGTPSCVAGACSATCELDASVALKVCSSDTDLGISCNECCVDSDCTATPDKCHTGACTGGFCAYPAKSCVIVDCHVGLQFVDGRLRGSNRVCGCAVLDEPSVYSERGMRCHGRVRRHRAAQWHAVSARGLHQWRDVPDRDVRMRCVADGSGAARDDSD